MASADAARTKITELSKRASWERGRAARAAAIAAAYEARRDLTPASMQPMRSRMAALHRRLEARHLESARLQELYASKLDTWSRRPDASTAWPTFIDAVAAAIGRKSTAVTLLDTDGTESLAAASDHTARLAHDVEYVMGQGPAHDAVATKLPVRVDGDELTPRWPRYGPVVADNGVGSVIGLPLSQQPGCIGALCIYDPTPAVAADVATITARVADALTHTVLNIPGAVEDDQIPAVPMFDEPDFLTTVHQAAGIISVQLACQMTDAAALLRARAFADGLPVETLAHRVIRGQVQI